MEIEDKINLVCVGSVGESFFQFIQNKPKLFNTLLLNRADGIAEQKDVGSNYFAELIFCVLGASSIKNISKIKSLFHGNPILWQKTYFILVHPFNFEGESKSKVAKDFSEFVTFKGSKKTDFRNQDLFKHINEKAKFEDGFKIMNKWIFSIIEKEQS